MSKTYSDIIAGTMNWGAWGKQLCTKDMADLMYHCLDCGITTFDHADIYGDYSTESEFGKALADSNIKREDIQLISKCGIQYLGNSRPGNKVKHYDYNKNYIIWSVEQSLKNLQTDYLDLLLLHRPSPLLNPMEVAEAITTLKKAGKIKDFGVSNFLPSQINLLQKYIEVSVNQQECSITHFDPLLDGNLDYLQTHNIQAMAWSPLGSFFKEDTSQTKRIDKVLCHLQKQYNASKDQLLLAWLLKHPANIIPVVGTTTPERLTFAIEASKIDLSQQDWFALLVASQGHKVP
ncbi:aldo/keto reductase [Mangrovimonas cancribranchiae]|uniref:Aldo/keto reductase n=1 Tax=Mangrovimonas cancribranchiae TaxID=3080055 RepID=A0AAU6NVC5_9FLAO